MFQFPGLAPRLLGSIPIARNGLSHWVPADRFVFANPRRFSQLVAPFIASESQGIPRTPFVTFFNNENPYIVSSNPRYSVIRKIFLQFVTFIYFPSCQRTLKETLLNPPKGGNRKSIFPKITKESNLAYGTSPILCSFVLDLKFRFRVGFSTLNSKLLSVFQYFF